MHSFGSSFHDAWIVGSETNLVTPLVTLVMFLNGSRHVKTETHWLGLMLTRLTPWLSSNVDPAMVEVPIFLQAT